MPIAGTSDQWVPRGVHVLAAEEADFFLPLRRAYHKFGNRIAQAAARHVVRRGAEIRNADPAAYARFLAAWRERYVWLDKPSMMNIETDAVRTRAPVDGGAAPIPADWFAPRDSEPQGVVFYVHGGSFIIERSPRITSLVARFAAAAEARVFAPNYRLAPEHPCPAAVEDIVAAYRWYRQRWPDVPVVALAESAGAAILLAAMQTIRDAGEALPRGIMLLSPWVDLSLQSWSVVQAGLAGTSPYTMDLLSAMVHLYLQGRSAVDPVASPLFGDFSGFPPVLVHASKDDILFDDAVRLADCVRAAGGNLTVRFWMDETHVWERMHSVKARQSISRAADFIRACLDP